VIAGRAENAVLVPVEAVRSWIQVNMLFLLSKNTVQKRHTGFLRVVTIGLQDVTSAEITSGLQAGEIVSTGITQTQ